MEIKVAHLTSAHPRYDTRIFHKQCLSLAAAGYDVSLLVADGKGDEVNKSIKIIDVGRASNRLARMLVSPRQICHRALLIDADIYHLHDPELLPIGLKLQRRGKLVIFDAHEDLPKQILNKHYLRPSIRKVISFFASKYEKYACAKIAGVVSATPYINDKFLRVSSNVVNINNYPILAEFDRTSASWTDRSKSVCYVGGIARTRGAVEAVQAMEICSYDTSFYLAGWFSQATLKGELESLGGWSKVKYLGFVDREQVAEIYNSVMAGLVNLYPTPNYIDALPVKMFEYMAAGIPVISSNIELWRAIVEEANCGICVDPYSPESIAAAINYIVNNPEQAERMGENGRIAVREKYNWGQEEHKLLTFYKVLSGGLDGGHDV